jgi:hypothetical protein
MAGDGIRSAVSGCWKRPGRGVIWSGASSDGVGSSRSRRRLNEMEPYRPRSVVIQNAAVWEAYLDFR